MELKSKFYRFWKMLAERKSREHYRELYKAEYEYYSSYADKKPASVMKREMNVLQKYWGCYPFQYIRYGMYKKDCKLSLEEMKDYIPNFFAYFLLFPKSYKEYGIISEDKILTYLVFETLGVKQPTLLLQYNHGLFYDFRKNPIGNKEVDEIIEQTIADKLFLKPSLGLGGQGILVFNKKEKFIDEEGNQISAEFIKKNLDKKEDYILQEGIRQHDELNQIYPHSVNTFRVNTRIIEGKAHILFSFLRMGRGGGQLDNASLKGFVCKVDPETGEFAPEGTSKLFTRIDKHPDTNFEFAGYKFPYWKEVREFVLKAANKLENIGCIGWDIAYSVDGPMVIEINAGAGLQSLQDNYGGVRKAFGVDNPKTYWYSKNYGIKDM
ncbi:sugar-transfer associated ATP-grasp domain-containing protein [Marinifilum sp. RC60d5]|uniref:sugar-transfer associated ATP-grasp domain-containing protein n=1 Tax=Marinifilum sp. RC60d5 TaxID=3458414 RepID=UPI0040371119